MTRRALVPFVLSVLAFASACGKADGELTPGNWKGTMTMTRFDIPGAPPELAQRAKAALGQGQSSESCMSPLQAKAGVRDFSSSMQQGECRMDNFKQGGGTMSGTMVCTSGAFGATSMAMTGTYAPESVKMTLSGEIASESLPGGKANIEMTIDSMRTGECSAAKKAG